VRRPVCTAVVVLQQTRAYLQSIVKGSLPQVLAVAENEVVGFCDILPNAAKGFAHVGRLGMGGRFKYRIRSVHQPD
jgi:hypothetical protein